MGWAIAISFKTFRHNHCMLQLINFILSWCLVSHPQSSCKHKFLKSFRSSWSFALPISSPPPINSNASICFSSEEFPNLFSEEMAKKIRNATQSYATHRVLSKVPKRLHHGLTPAAPDKRRSAGDHSRADPACHALSPYTACRPCLETRLS